MKSDREVQDEVLAALEWEPGVNAAQIGVTVSDSVITLRGTVSTLQKKLIAERAATSRGVRAIANDLEVSLPGSAAGSDSAIAEVAANALELLSTSRFQALSKAIAVPAVCIAERMF